MRAADRATAMLPADVLPSPQSDHCTVIALSSIPPGSVKVATAPVKPVPCTASIVVPVPMTAGFVNVTVKLVVAEAPVGVCCGDGNGKGTLVR